MPVASYVADFADGQVPQQFVYDRDGFQLTTDVPAGYTYSQRFAAIGNSATTYFEFTLTLDVDGTISFYRKVSSESCCDKLRFDIDGVEQASYGGEVAWGQVSFPVTAGTHTFRWRYTKDASAANGSDTAWVTGIEVTNVLDPPPIHTGDYAHVTHDFEDGLVPSGWTGSWTPSTTSPIAGTYSLMSNDIADSQTTDMTWSYTPPENGVVHAAMKVSSEAADHHRILVNGVLTTSISGEASTVARPIVRGGVATTVTHRYVKDASISQGSDTAWVDDVLQPWAAAVESRLARLSAEALTTAPSDARLARLSVEALTAAVAPTSVGVVAAAETEAAAVTAVVSATAVTVLAAAESETAQPVGVTFDQAVAVAIAAETEAAPTVISAFASTAVRAIETETASPVDVAAGPVAVTVTSASEADGAQPVLALTPQTRAVGGASETEAATVQTHVTSYTVAVASEAEQPGTVGAASTFVVSRATETETAGAVTIVRHYTAEPDPAFVVVSAHTTTVDHQPTVTPMPATLTQAPHIKRRHFTMTQGT